MTGVGDKVGSHALDPPGGSEVTKELQDPWASAGVLLVDGEHCDLNFEPPLGRDALDEVGFHRAAVPHNPLHGFEHIRVAQSERERLPGLERGQQPSCRATGLEHHHAMVDNDHRVRNVLEEDARNTSGGT